MTIKPRRSHCLVSFCAPESSHVCVIAKGLGAAGKKTFRLISIIAKHSSFAVKAFSLQVIILCWWSSAAPHWKLTLLLTWCDTCFIFLTQCWENGILLCRELADQYEAYYDYRNLSKMKVCSSVDLNQDLFILQWNTEKLFCLRLMWLTCFFWNFQMMEASLYDKIMDQQRLEPEFFRVGFYGKKFPFFLRVSGDTCQKLRHRLSKEYDRSFGVE